MAIKNALKTHMLQTLIDSFSINSKDSSYLFISRPEGWSDDSSPDNFIDCTNDFNDVWKRMIAAKKISSVDAYLMIPRNSWVSGSTYGMYTDNDDMSGITFYTTNSENNVYKCIFNGLSGGSTTSTKTSTDQPLGAQSSTITTGDGFKWKFMYKIPEAWTKFADNDYIPVKKLKIEDNVPEKYSDDRFLQYSTQYNSVNGTVEYIDLTASGSSYGNNVQSKNFGFDVNIRTKALAAANVGTGGTIQFNLGESTTDDFYNTYSVNIVSGVGVGQSRRIDDYTGSTRTATLSSSWDTIPDTTSIYEVMPEVIIDGDGVGAEATAVIESAGGITLEGVRVTKPGSGYTRAIASIKTSTPIGAALEPYLSPYGGHGFDPVSELRPSRLMVIVTLDREDSAITGGNLTGTFPIVNDFRQYGLIKNPVLATGPRKGEVAGTEVQSTSTLNVSAATGSVFNFGDFTVGDLVIGESSKSCGEVVNWFRNTDTSKGTLNLLDVDSEFLVGESIRGLGTGAEWTSSNKGLGYVQFQEDPVITQTNSSYRLTTYLEIQSTAGNAGHTYLASNFDLDQVIGGASGSSATIVEYIPSGGQTASLYLTTLLGSSGADSHGFTINEKLAGVTISSAINKIEIPEFVKGAGEILYINNSTPITRQNEQEEEVKIIIDL
tara:strand:- start:23029 stop:25014 length:1986 start_codon:yes stop_codon:yes gene_type:complete